MNKSLFPLIFNDTRSDHHYGCDAVMAALFKLMERATVPPPGHCYSVSQSKTNRAYVPRWLTDLSLPAISTHTGMIIVNGEGSIHHSNRKAYGIAAIASFAEEIGVPSVLLNATVYKNCTEIYDQLKKFKLIYVRDSASQRILNRNNISSQIAPDLTFFYDFEKTVPLGEPRDICVTDSILATVSAQLETFRAKNNLELCSIIHSDETSDFFFYVQQLKRYKLVVTGRYHAVCFCINAKIPFLAVESNTNKISSLLKDVFDTDYRLISVKNLLAVDTQKYDQFTATELTAIDDYKIRHRESFSAVERDLQNIWKQSHEENDEEIIRKKISSFKRHGLYRRRLHDQFLDRVVKVLGKRGTFVL